MLAPPLLSFTLPPPSALRTLSLHDALPISFAEAAHDRQRVRTGVGEPVGVELESHIPRVGRVGQHIERGPAGVDAAQLDAVVVPMEAQPLFSQPSAGTIQAISELSDRIGIGEIDTVHACR